MFQFPLVASSPAVISPSTAATTTATTTAHLAHIPTTYLVNSVQPCIVYDTKFSTSVLANEIPVAGFFVQNSVPKKENEKESDSKLDEYIKQLVSKEIEKLKLETSTQQEEKTVEVKDEKQKETAVETNKDDDKCAHTVCSCCCCCCCPYEKEKANESQTKVDNFDYVLNLDEKIRKIREELNLAEEKDELAIRKHKNEEASEAESHDVNSLRSSSRASLTSKYHVDCIKPGRHESRAVSSASVERRHRSVSRSRSRSRSRPTSASSISTRPPWRPTGHNIYGQNRFDFFPDSSKLLSKQQQASTQTTNSDMQTRPNYSYEYYYVKDPVYYQEATRPKSTAYYTITSAKPAKTTVKTTIELAPKQQNAGYSYYLPPINSKTTNSSSTYYYNAALPTKSHQPLSILKKSSSGQSFYQSSSSSSTNTNSNLYYTDSSKVRINSASNTYLYS